MVQRPVAGDRLGLFVHCASRARRKCCLVGQSKRCAFPIFLYGFDMVLGTTSARQIVLVTGVCSMHVVGLLVQEYSHCIAGRAVPFGTWQGSKCLAESRVVGPVDSLCNGAGHRGLDELAGG